MAASYPKRIKYFAHKYVRILQKSCAAMDIGQAACLLCTYIAHTEDAARYSGPVRYWNEQLMNVMGFTSPKQLVSARNKAIEYGWLHYERDKNRTVGKYWVLIPEDLSGHDDGMIEDDEETIDRSNYTSNQVENGTNCGMNSKRKAEREGDELRNEKVTESGKHSNPYPYPNPNPSPKESALDSGEVPKPPKPKSRLDEQAEAIYQAYPRKAGRGTAIQRIKQAFALAAAEELLEAVQAYARATETWPPEDKQFIPHPATWFHQQRWMDDRSTWAAKQRGSPRDNSPQAKSERSRQAAIAAGESIKRSVEKQNELRARNQNGISGFLPGVAPPGGIGEPGGE
jgi:hypothetical protein